MRELRDRRRRARTATGNLIAELGNPRSRAAPTRLFILAGCWPKACRRCAARLRTQVTAVFETRTVCNALDNACFERHYPAERSVACKNEHARAPLARMPEQHADQREINRDTYRVGAAVRRSTVVLSATV
jgi:hypothetical protein